MAHESAYSITSPLRLTLSIRVHSILEIKMTFQLEDFFHGGLLFPRGLFVHGGLLFSRGLLLLVKFFIPTSTFGHKSASSITSTLILTIFISLRLSINLIIFVFLFCFKYIWSYFLYFCSFLGKFHHDQLKFKLWLVTRETLKQEYSSLILLDYHLGS